MVPVVLPGRDARIDRLDESERQTPAQALVGARGFFTDANGCVARAAWEEVPFVRCRMPRITRSRSTCFGQASRRSISRMPPLSTPTTTQTGIGSGAALTRGAPWPTSTVSPSRLSGARPP